MESSAPHSPYASSVASRPIGDSSTIRNWACGGISPTARHIGRKAVRARIEAARIKVENELIDHIRSHADAIGFPGELGVSRAVNGICLRVLTTRGNDAFDLIKDVSDFVVA